ncbi:MAG: hypothetical protein P8Z31_03255 [Gammaproteobacteria bacterium]
MLSYSLSCSAIDFPKRMSEYKPVACDMHSLYELAVMQRTAALVRWRQDD